LKKFLNIVSNYWKGLTAIGSAVGVIWAASATYQKKKTADIEFQNEVREYIVVSKDHTTLTDTRLERIERGMYELNDQVSLQYLRQEAMQKSLIQSFAKNPSITKDDYDYLLNILLDIKKNNSKESGWIEIPYRIEKIPFNSILSLNRYINDQNNN